MPVTVMLSSINMQTIAVVGRLVVWQCLIDDLKVYTTTGAYCSFISCGLSQLFKKKFWNISQKVTYECGNEPLGV